MEVQINKKTNQNIQFNRDKNSNKSSAQFLGSESNRESKQIKSLSALTTEFIIFLKGQPNLTSEIQYASNQLNISKRRIYDILNVLDGIGYVQKLGKNLVKWVGNINEIQQIIQTNMLQVKTTQLIKDISSLKLQIQKQKKNMAQQLNCNKELNYLNAQDVQILAQYFQSDKLTIDSLADNERYYIIKNNSNHYNLLKQ